jgi:uncharacterized membrane-anchored protein
MSIRAQPDSKEGKKKREMRQPSLPHNRLGHDWNAYNPATYPRRPPRWPSKVPEVITIYFWIAKLLTTALGESTSDALVFGINKYVAVGIGFVGLVVALILQFAVRRYIPWTYWFAVTMVAVFGTMAADVLHIVILTPLLGSASEAYLVATIGFSICLVVVFSGWYLVERTLSIHSITTVRREVFYWAAVMVTFALGTASGDMTAITLHLGYFRSIFLFAILIALPAIGYLLLGLNEILAFWLAYILTRPLGASIADWLGKSVHVGGLGLGDLPVSLVLTMLIIIVVGYLAVSRRDMASRASS